MSNISMTSTPKLIGQRNMEHRFIMITITYGANINNYGYHILNS